MQCRVLIPACCVLALLVSGPVASGVEATPVKLKQGVHCQEQKVEPFEGETHRCYFSPHRFGKRDFSTRNGRAMYVISELGPDCDEIEILGDGESKDVAANGGTLKQVTVHCSK